jgi:hypothetical protein
MAYVVERPGLRYEIRESELTDRGPRARSLASFRMLDDVVLAKARARALRPFDPAAVRRSARRVGAPVDVADPAERSARSLLAELANGAHLAPGLAGLMRRALASDYVPDDNVEAMVPWITASPTERGVALHDLLELGDRLPARRREPSAFPRIRTTHE